MKLGARMKRQEKSRYGLAIAAVLALAACQDGTGPFAKQSEDDGGVAAAAQSAVSVERDVEAPDVFQLNGEGLWDGRPSLGGVWVAHSTVTDPERVMIRNPRNGRTVVGALFRRERENPGPSLQVSSDAAEALGMLAGQPAELSVVALRREETPLPATNDAVENVEIAADSGTADGATDGTATDGPATDGAAAEIASVDSGAAVAVEPAKKRRGLFGLFRRKPKGEPAAAAPVADAADAGAIEQSTLEDVTASASAAIDRAEAAAAPAPAPAPASTLKRAYVQIGIFSEEANANRAASQMKAAGMTATVIPDQSQGKTYWRVVIGPAASVAERDALATRVKGIGYPDAYPVSK